MQGQMSDATCKFPLLMQRVDVVLSPSILFQEQKNSFTHSAVYFHYVSEDIKNEGRCKYLVCLSVSSTKEGSNEQIKDEVYAQLLVLFSNSKASFIRSSFQPD